MALVSHWDECNQTECIQFCGKSGNNQIFKDLIDAWFDCKDDNCQVCSPLKDVASGKCKAITGAAFFEDFSMPNNLCKII